MGSGKKPKRGKGLKDDWRVSEGDAEENPQSPLLPVHGGVIPVVEA